ncbi:probable folate-biopterin transporter 4 [Neltuma alba]|uniref:probable folate-biopterin transporter 4 n=1 Tax=Neltuma alba TaxID=207710 RepID=UPI0010A56502|nr:probable folate-biopterin transporter 4 [Prosopis alba]
MIKWTKRLIAAFGASFLWLICSIYFTQGFRSFVWTAISYQLKDKLKLSPSASQYVSSVAFFPWSVKPLYGILSDCIPIRRRKRIPYLVIATVLSLVPWLILGSNSTSRDSKWHLMIFLTVQNLGSAMADVVVDAMIAEATRYDQASFAGDLQLMSWMAMALGGICGSLLGGYVLSNLHIDIIFLLFAVLPTFQLISCQFVVEKPIDGKSLQENSISRVSTSNVITSDEDSHFIKKYTRSVKRRKKGKKNSKSWAVRTRKSDIIQKDDSLTLKQCHSIKAAIYDLCCAFRQPMILRPMSWFFLAHVINPDLSTVVFYYQTEVLKLQASFLGTARVFGWLGLMLGTFIYNHHFKYMKLRRILMCAHVGLSLVNLQQIIVVSRISITYGISDKTMVLWGSALGDAINQFKFMPFLILSGQLCPPGIEGTLFALFMSINNLGSTLGSFVGAGLASVLNIDSQSFDNLLFGIIIHAICNFVPIGFLFLIPKEATGILA